VPSVHRPPPAVPLGKCLRLTWFDVALQAHRGVLGPPAVEQPEAAFAQLAELAYPQPIVQPGTPLDELHRRPLAGYQADLRGDEFILWPIRSRILVVGQAGDAPLLCCWR